MFGGVCGFVFCWWPATALMLWFVEDFGLFEEIMLYC